jgi:peptidylprolyl isomerase
MIQGGDITARDGTGGRSAFGVPFRGECGFLEAYRARLLIRHRREFFRAPWQAWPALYGKSWPRNQHFPGNLSHCLACTLRSLNGAPQYFITTAAAPWCDGKNVVFGEVKEGLEVVKLVQSYASADILRRPSATILVERSGLV